MINIKNLHKSYPKQKKSALKGINLKIQDGEILSLVGESGSGKSTFLKILSGSLAAEEGSLDLFGEDYDLKYLNLRKQFENVNLVDQNSEIPLNLSISGIFNRAMMAYKDNFRKKSIKDVIDLFGIKKILENHSHEISGGERQRVSLALAILTQPKLILLDEAFNSMDSHLKEYVQRRYFEILKDLGITCVYVSHDPRDALAYCDRVLVMRKGKLLEKGSPANIYSQPSHLYTAKLFGDYVLLDNKGKLIKSAKNLKLNTEDVRLLRPESIEIKEDSKGKYTLEKKLFRGDYYEYLLKNEELSFVVKSMKNLNSKLFSIKLPSS